MYFKKYLVGSISILENFYDYFYVVCKWERCVSGLIVISMSYRLDVKYDEFRYCGINYEFCYIIL